MAGPFLKLALSLGPIGYLRGGGTWASLLTVVLLYAFRSVIPPAAAAAVLICLSVWVLKRYFGQSPSGDPSWVVLDEVAGMGLALAWGGTTLKDYLIPFALFRFFDIVKPLGIRYAEKGPEPLSILWDDVWAGAYALILWAGLRQLIPQ